jgi:integrase
VARRRTTSTAPGRAGGPPLGKVSRRCGCRDEHGNLVGTACPKRQRTGHGQWFYRIELPADADGNRRPRRRSGFPSGTAAQNELDHARDLLAIPEDDDPEARRRVGDMIATAITNNKPLPGIEQVRALLRAKEPLLQHPTLAEWLPQWLKGKKKLSRNAYRSYESHIRLYLIRYLGDVRLDKLRVGHVADMFDQIVEHNYEIIQARASKDAERREQVRYQRPVGNNSMHRIRETLRAALNAAIREELITFNAAKWVEMPEAIRPTPLVWTPERVERWKQTGKPPSPVMVWTPQQTGRFLDHALNDRLYPLYHLVAHRGLRRGEACGLRWVDTHLEDASIDVLNQIVQYGWETDQTRPKTEESMASVALDETTVAVLAEHRVHQHAERRALQAKGGIWVDSGLVFTQPEGSALHPADVTEQFHHLARQAGLPPIRLHDLRHGAATLALAAGVDMKVVQHMMRHASMSTTSDTYTSVLPDIARAAAEKIADSIPRAIRLPDNQEL